jgi:hypothetical protein
MKPTQSRIHERRQWEEYLKNKPYEDDIWWEKRKPAPVAIPAHKNSVQSRLTEPTVAALHGKREKHPVKKEDLSRVESPSREHVTSVAKIDIHSPLLKSTCAFNHQQVDREGNLLYPPEDNRVKTIQLEGKHSGPTVTSKLMQNTKSFEHSKWTSSNASHSSGGSDGERKDSSMSAIASPRRSSLDKMKPPSARLLEFNTAMNAQRREKVIRPEPDKREMGWNQFHHKDKIPTQLPSFVPMHRSGSASGSPSTSPTRRSFSSNSQDFQSSSTQKHVFQRMTKSLENEHLHGHEGEGEFEQGGEYEDHHEGDEEYGPYDDEYQEYHDHGDSHYNGGDEENMEEDDGNSGEEHFQEVSADALAHAVEYHEEEGEEGSHHIDEDENKEGSGDKDRLINDQ